MRIIPLTQDNPLDDAIALRGFMLFPDDEQKREELIKASSALEWLKQIRLAQEGEEHILIPKKVYDDAAHAIDYLFLNHTELKRREVIGLRAGSIAAMLITHKLFYKKTGAKKSPSLNEAKDVLIGSAIEVEKATGVNRAHNKKTLNEAWQRYGHVSHFWFSENLLQIAIRENKVDSSMDFEAINKRIGGFLHHSKMALNLISDIVPHGRKEPVFDADKAYWLEKDFDMLITPDDEETLIKRMEESTMLGIKDYLKRFKGAKNLGKIKMKEKISA